VSADTVYTWVNTDNPDEKIEVPWLIIGQMEDASQAFGAANTYCNRYFLMKSLQLATTEADPDEYRGKQQMAGDYERNKQEQLAKEALQEAIKKVVDAGTELIKVGVDREQIFEVVGRHNNGKREPSTISTIEVCELIIKDFNNIKKKSNDATKKTEGAKVTPAKGKEKTNNEKKEEKK
jgi:hypothetical protein